MAEPLKRSQLIQQQIEDLRRNAPPALTQAERDQIMSKRKGQADIDAGRQSIADRERVIADHAAKVDSLISKYDSAVKDETAQGNREGDERTRQEREANASPLWNTFLPAGAGAVGGAAIGEAENRILHQFNKGNAEAVKEIARELGPTDRLTNSVMNRSRAAGAAAAAEKYAPSSLMRQGGAVAGRALSYGIPAGIFANEYSKYAERAADPKATEADRMANQRIANGLLGVATGIGADGGMRFFFPSRHEGEGEAMMRINTARDYARRMDQADADRALTERLRRVGGAADSRPLTTVDPMERLRGAVQTADAPQSLPPPQSTPQPPTRNSSTLINAAKASGASGRLTKASAAEHLLANVTDSNRGAIAKALGVSNGPNLHSRVVQAIKAMASKPGASVIIPGTIGYSVYDALRSPAEAGEGDEASEPMSRPAAATAGAGAAAATGGAIASGRALASRLASGPLGVALRGVGRVAGPVGAALGAYDLGNMAVEENQNPANFALTNGLPEGNFPKPPGNPEFFARQQQQAQSAYGDPGQPSAPAPQPEPVEPPPDDAGGSEFDRLVTASQQDPELAAMLRDAILARVQQANEQMVPNAMASQAVASRGADPMAAALRNFAQR
jgi:hypothetical protein